MCIANSYMAYYRISAPIMATAGYGLYPIAPMSISCTPHFVPDAESPWVTKESLTSMHYWFNPENKQTLLQVVEQIEAWASHDYQVTLRNIGGYTMNIMNMEIRGVMYNRDVLAGKTTNEYFRNEETFTLRFRPRGNALASCAIM